MNVLKILAALVIVALIAAALIILVFPRFEQTAWITTKAFEFKDTALAYVQSNLTLVMGSVGTLVTIGGAAASKISSVKQQAQATVDSAKGEVDKLKAEKDGVTKQIEETKGSFESQINDLKLQTEEAKKAAEAKASEAQKLQKDIDNLTQQNKDFVNGLKNAANGDLVKNPVDGNLYSVLKLPPEEVIKVK